ncbi:MAG: hypothetical protein C4346_09095 [Chloroflexota bacterium]
MEFIRINGTAVRLTGFHQRTVEQVDGPPLRELELVVIVRGTLAHRSLLELMAQNRFVVDLPADTDGAQWTTLEATLAGAFHQSTGVGEAAAHRHDIRLRETPESAARHQAATAPSGQAAPGEGEEPSDEAEGDQQNGDAASPDDEMAGDVAEVQVPGNPSVWAAALRQLRTQASGRTASPPEPPLTTEELAGAEAVLVGLRLEALLEQLAAAGLIRRSVVESNFQRLVRERFVQEATPVIGESAARRIVRDVTGE